MLTMAQASFQHEIATEAAASIGYSEVCIETPTRTGKAFDVQAWVEEEMM
jgi:hypothetical protein